MVLWSRFVRFGDVEWVSLETVVGAQGRRLAEFVLDFPMGNFPSLNGGIGRSPRRFPFLNHGVGSFRLIVLTVFHMSKTRYREGFEPVVS